jgi:hypothetical protein
MIAEERRFEPAATVSWNDAADELTLFDSASGCYFALNVAAVAIWRELAAGRSVGEAIATLIGSFAAPRDAIADDVAAFVRTALERNLLVARG